MNNTNRSFNGFKKFLTGPYEKKKGEGQFLSPNNYCGHMKKILRVTGKTEKQLHQMTKIEFLQFKASFEDLHRHLHCASDYRSGAESYYQYIRYTLGYYQRAAA